MVLYRLGPPGSTLTPPELHALRTSPRFGTHFSVPTDLGLTRDRDHQRRQRNTGGNAADDVRPFPAVAQSGPFRLGRAFCIRPEEALARLAHRQELHPDAV